MTQKIFDRHNLNLLKSLIPNKELPIYGNSFFDPNNEDFNKPIKDLKYENICGELKYLSDKII